MSREAPRRAALAAVGLLVGILAHGCASERGIRDPATPTAAENRPVASPVIGASTISRVTYAIRPLGLVPFDQQVLPIPSPDGTRLAVETGQGPSWAALLGEPGATADGTGVAIYDISGPPVLAIGSDGSESGLLLGRASDQRGVLVESPRPDGSRWIGRMSWTTGEIDWLAVGNRVNAHGVLTPDGSLVFVASELDGGSPRLVLRTAAGLSAEFAVPALTALFPIACDDPSLVAAVMLGESGLDLVAIRVQPRASGAPELGPVVFRTRATASRSTAVAYQMAQPTLGVMTGSHGWGSVIVWHPGSQRAVEIDLRGGPQRPLAEGSIAAVRWEGDSGHGYFVTGTSGLGFQPRDQSGPGASPRVARVIDVPAVARATNSRERPLILLAPSAQPDRIEASVLIPGLAPEP